MKQVHTRCFQLALLVPLLAVACSSGVGGGTDPSGESSEEIGSSKSALSGWLGPISDEAAFNNRSFGSPNIATNYAFCGGKRCDDNWIFGAALPAGVTTGVEHPTGVVISEEAPNNASFCVNSSGFLSGVVTGLRASGSWSDNLELICAPVSFSGSHFWGTCGWTPFFSEENGGSPPAASWPLNKFAAGIRCSGANCDNVSYYICNFT